MNTPPVDSRDALVRHIHSMVDDYDQCENRDVETFLNAMAAWLGDCGGYYRNTGQTVNIDEPSWQIIADALSAATVYD